MSIVRHYEEVGKLLETALPKWISVEDRLPGKHSEVLAVVNGHVILTWFHSKIKCFETYAGICFFVSENMVTHWMPLPAPPKEEITNEN